MGDHSPQAEDNPSSNPIEEVHRQSTSFHNLPRGSNSQMQVGETILSRSENEHSREQSEDILRYWWDNLTDEEMKKSSFDLSTWYDVTGSPSKGRLYGFGSNSSSTSGSSVSSTIKAFEEKLNELTKSVEDMRSNATKMEEEFSRREEENRKIA
ncbi:hypothetical protein Salat_1709900 [Sesamum alatum]|uniref:Uncharacterized protein n=1 Tax=Sesamum alatum TaxID=300844 RepID=A0AAE1Y7T5_9LAMI|nr:hypothetical protein Salat_1709900 [Sesamum alatum]